MREQLEPPRESENPPALAPLCVDLDGTLIRSDLLIESLLSLLRKNVFFLFLLPLWLFGGKAALKQQVAERVELDVSRLPYNDVFLGFLREEKRRGRVLTRVMRETAAQLGVIGEKCWLCQHPHGDPFVRTYPALSGPGCVKSRTWCDRTLKSPLSHDTTPFNERSRGRIPSSG